VKLSPDTVDRWRVIPRALITLYGVQCWRVGEWFMALAAPTMEQAAFVSVLWGAAAVWFNFYVNSGPKGKGDE